MRSVPHRLIINIMLARLYSSFEPPFPTRTYTFHDCTTLHATYARTIRYDSGYKHLWTYVRVVSVTMMSIAHDSNSVVIAVWSCITAYMIYKSAAASEGPDAPI